MDMEDILLPWKLHEAYRPLQVLYKFLQTHFPEGTWFCFSVTPNSQLHSVEMTSVGWEDGPRLGKGTRGATSRPCLCDQELPETRHKHITRQQATGETGSPIPILMRQSGPLSLTSFLTARFSLALKELNEAVLAT